MRKMEQIKTLYMTASTEIKGSKLNESLVASSSMSQVYVMVKSSFLSLRNKIVSIDSQNLLKANLSFFIQNIQPTFDGKKEGHHFF